MDKLDLDTVATDIGSKISSEEDKIRGMVDKLDPSNTQDVMKLNLEYSRYTMEEQTMAALISTIRKMIENITQRM